MFDLLFGLRLLFNAFSTDRKSMRFPYPKRMLTVFIFLPGLLLLVLVNRIFMALDWIFFPWFINKKVRQPVFITGTPRSATTFLYDALAADQQHFTATRFWEMAFAPSIIQKFFFRFLSVIDRNTGRPLYRLSGFADRIFFSRMKQIHELSFSKPEEDEMLLSYAMSTMMLVFLFPEVKAMDRLLYFDELMPEKKRKRIMRFYKRCVQRHLFVFDRQNTKIYLSKNPCFVCKTASIAERFPDARLIYTLRSPYKTIPSTISLNANLYSFFGKRTEASPLAEITAEILIRWYSMADRSLQENWKGKYLVAPFRKITSKPGESVREIYQFLRMEISTEMQKRLVAEEEKSRNHSSGHRYDVKAGTTNPMIEKELDFVLNGPYADEI